MNEKIRRELDEQGKLIEEILDTFIDDKKDGASLSLLNGIAKFIVEGSKNGTISTEVEIFYYGIIEEKELLDKAKHIYVFLQTKFIE